MNARPVPTEGAGGARPARLGDRRGPRARVRPALHQPPPLAARGRGRAPSDTARRSWHPADTGRRAAGAAGGGDPRQGQLGRGRARRDRGAAPRQGPGGRLPVRAQQRGDRRRSEHACLGPGHRAHARRTSTPTWPCSSSAKVSSTSPWCSATTTRCRTTCGSPTSSTTRCISSAPRPGQALRDHADSPWIAGCERCRRELVGACEGAGFTPRIMYTSDDPLVQQSMVAAGLGVTTHARTVRRPAPGARHRDRPSWTTSGGASTSRRTASRPTSLRRAPSSQALIEAAQRQVRVPPAAKARL